MSTYSEKSTKVQRLRVHHLTQAKQRGEKLVMLTAYDAVTARILDAAGTDMLLVGDSIGNTMLGRENTLEVTLDENGGSYPRRRQCHHPRHGGS